MLRILFINEDAQDDSIAVNVKDIRRWKKVIVDICEKAEQGRYFSITLLLTLY